VTGQVRAFRATPPGPGLAPGQERVLSTMGPGDVFGEAAALGDRVRTASVDAVTDCSLLVFHADDLLGDVEVGSPLRAFVAALAKRFRAAEERAEKAEAALRSR
jgi:CRP-like cAMP-binding protein